MCGSGYLDDDFRKQNFRHLGPCPLGCLQDNIAAEVTIHRRGWPDPNGFVGEGDLKEATRATAKPVR